MPHNHKPVRKFFCNQTDEKDYFCHCRNLIFQVRMGMDVIKLKTVKRFKQKAWMKNYTDKNT